MKYPRSAKGSYAPKHLRVICGVTIVARVVSGPQPRAKQILDIGHAVVRHTSSTTDPLDASTSSRARKRMNHARAIKQTPSVNRASSASRSRAGFPSRKPSNPAGARGCFRAYTTGSDHA